MTKLGRFWVVLACALILPTCGRLFAGVTASISGTVTDATGAAVVGATVTATNVDTGVTRADRLARLRLLRTYRAPASSP